MGKTSGGRRTQRLALVLGLGLLALPILVPIWNSGWLQRLRPQAPTGRGAYPGRNVVLFTIDTLRADHLPLYGYHGVETPRIDGLARHSLVFENAISHIPLTLPSHASMLTGLLPPGHGLPDNGAFVLDPKITTLPEILKGKGYATGAFVSSVILDSRWQLNKGFDAYFDGFYEGEGEGQSGRIRKPGDETVGEAETWIAAHKDAPFFAWVHIYEPHEPRQPAEPYRSRYPKSTYDAEIAISDGLVGRFLDKLDALGLGDRTIFCLTSDHGENLGDHGELTHGLFIYEATQHVPLLIRLPGGRRQDVAPAVGHSDLAPTFLEWLGLDPPPQMQGTSLIALIEGQAAPDREVYSESRLGALHYGWAPLESLTTERLRYIEAPRPELYDRQADPGEKSNLAADRAETSRHLAGDLKQLLARVQGQAPQRQEIDADTEERLAALGYVGSALPDPVSGGGVIDPKDVVQLHDRLAQAQGMLIAKQAESALEMITPVVREAPTMADAHRVRGEALLRLKRYDEAIEEFRVAIAGHPDNPKLLFSLATTYQGLGRYGEAEPLLLRVVDKTPRQISALIHLGHLYTSLRQPEKARRHFLAAAALYEDMLAEPVYARRTPELRSKLAEVAFRGGDAERAVRELKAAIAAAPQKPALNYNLALVYEHNHDLPAAIASYQRETEIAPHNYRAFRGLGVALRETGRPDEALAALQRALAIQPKDPESCYRMAETLFLAGRDLAQARRFAGEAVSLAPRFSEARQLLGQIDRKLGRS